MGENKKVYFTAMLSKISIIFISIFTSALVNRQLGVALKGEYAYITNIVSMLVIVLSFGIGQTYSTFRRKEGNKVLGFFLFLTIVQTIISFIFSVLFLFFEKKVLAIVFLLTSSGIFRVNVLYYAAIENVKKRDINNIIYKIVYLFVILIYYLFMPSSIYILLLITFLEDLLIIVATLISFNFKPQIKNIKFSDIKKIYKLGFLCMIMHSLMTLNYSLDIFFLKNMTNSKMVGLYSVGVALANMLWLIPDAFKDVLVSKTSRDDSINEIVKVTKYSLYFSIILIIGFAIFGRLFISLLYGKEFINSYLCTIILFIGCLSMIIYKLIHPIYIAKGKQFIVVSILAVSVLANIIANLILIPHYNIYGAAIASVISYSLCSIIFLYIFCKEYKVSYKEFFIIRKNEIKQIINKTKKFHNKKK